MHLQQLLYRGRLRRSVSITLCMITLSLLVLTQVAHANIAVPGCTNGIGNVNQLKADLAILNTNGEADTIVLGAECIYDLDSTLTIQADGGNPITIEGNGAIISGVLSVRPFKVLSGATLHLYDVTIRDGKAPKENNRVLGGGIRNSGTVTMTNTTLSGNTAKNSDGALGWGGAIYNDGSLTLTSSTIYANHADEAAGGISNEGGTVTINHSNVQGNSSTYAGGIYNVGGGILTISGGMVPLNGAQYTGGILNHNSTLSMTGTSVGGNVASISGGGGITNLGGSITLSNTEIAQNVTAADGGGISNSGSAVLTNMIFQENSAANDGGGIYNNDGALTLTNSLLRSNSAPAGNGGGVFNGVAGTAEIINSTIYANGADYGGGVFSEGLTLTLLNSTVAYNVAASGNGGILVYNTTLIGNTIVAHNTGTDCANGGVLIPTGINFVADGTCSIAQALSGDPLLGVITGSPGYLPLLPGSQAIDSGSSDICPTTDQRGAFRPMDGDGNGVAVCDLGAYEADTVIVPTATDMPITTTPTSIAPTPTEPASGIELLQNGDFELKDSTQQVLLDPWKVKNPTGDKLKCNKSDKVIANTGECAFRFKGSVGEKAGLVQTVKSENFTFSAGDTLDLSLFIKATNSAVSGKVKLKVKYTDQTLNPDKVTLDLRPTSGYELFSGQTILKSGDVAKIKFQVSHTSVTGKVDVDTISLRQIGLECSTCARLIPLP